MISCVLHIDLSTHDSKSEDKMTDQEQQTPNFRVLITKDEDLYVAQGLEIGIFAQADNLAELAERFVMTYLLNKDAKMSNPAPEDVFDAWAEGEVLDADMISFGKNVIDCQVDVRHVAA
jgi:hypothetical protein